MPESAIGLGWRLSRWGGRVIIGHDGDTVGQSAYLQIDPEARVAVCLLTNAAESKSLFRELFNEVFGSLVGVEIPRARPGHRVPGAPAATGVSLWRGAWTSSGTPGGMSARRGGSPCRYATGSCASSSP